jgi:protein translocase SEC61 complex gamma subunit
VGIRSFLESSKRVLALVTRPTSKDLQFTIKIILIGTSIIGFIGFMIKFVATLLQA